VIICFLVSGEGAGNGLRRRSELWRDKLRGRVRSPLPRLGAFAWLAVMATAALPGSLSAAEMYDPRIRFNVTLDRKLGTNIVSGRLLVLMTSKREPMDVIEPSPMEMQSTWICAREVRGVRPGDVIELDPDLLAFPQPFSHAPGGNYQCMALLDTDHSLGYSSVGPGDLYGAVVRVSGLQPKQGGTVMLGLTQRVPASEPPKEDATHKFANLRSDLLSAFWGRTMEMHATVVLPPSYAASPAKRFPTVYYVHAFGASQSSAWGDANSCCGPSSTEMQAAMAAGKWPEMIYVFLDATCPLGHHAFADSVNNGPWARALVEEFIPYLERTYRMESTPGSRLLTGHSSGGWSTLWLQVTHPDFFGGVWSTSPDPVDFRSWSGLDLTKNPPENFYRKGMTRPRWLIRMDDREIVTTEDFGKWERVVAEYGGQFASFEAAFSPRSETGQPMRLFDRDTGVIDPVAQQAWSRYDIARLLKGNWAKLGPQLKGKLHVWVGTKDSIHLEESVYLLRDALKDLGSDATFTFLEGKTHFDMYGDGLAQKLAEEMGKAAEAARAKSNK